MTTSTKIINKDGSEKVRTRSEPPAESTIAQKATIKVYPRIITMGMYRI